MTDLKETLGEPVAWIKPDWQNPATYDGHSPVSTYYTNGWEPLYRANQLCVVPSVEVIAEATATIVYGPRFDPFTNPEAFNYCEKIATAIHNLLTGEA